MKKIWKSALAAGAAAALLSAVAPTPAGAATVAPCWMLDDPIHQVINPKSASSLLARSAVEATNAASFGFTDNQGVLFTASTETGQGLVAVRRLFNAKSQDFLFTANAGEAASAATSYGYKDEGIRFYVSSVAGNCTAPVKRYVRGSMHRLVVDPAQEAALVAAGWKSEGVKFHAVPNAPVSTGTQPGDQTDSLPTGAPTISAPLPPSGTRVKPTAATTGVPEGTPLDQYRGNILVTRDNTVIEGMDIHGFVTVRAKNVTIRNSIVRGGSTTFNQGLITNYGYAGLLVENVDLKPEFPSVYVDGIKGSDFTARRVHVAGGVDNVKIHGNNVTVEDSLLEDTQWFANDPNQGGNATHNDNVQILKGANLVLRGNTIRGATGFGVLGGADQGDLPDLKVVSNWIDGGWCSMKLEVRTGRALTATALDNKFGPNRGDSKCVFRAEPAVNLTESGNVFEADLRPISILRGA